MDTERFTLLPMTAAHLEQVALLEAVTFTDPWSKTALERALRNPHSHFVVVLEGERVVAYAGMQMVLDEGYIDNIAVAQDRRRMGLGRRMMETLAEQAASRGAAFLTLEVRSSNRGAIALYRAMGYKPVGRRVHYYRDPVEDALLMTRFFPNHSDKTAGGHVPSV